VEDGIAGTMVPAVPMLPNAWESSTGQRYRRERLSRADNYK
jgi:hypothetical protein